MEPNTEKKETLNENALEELNEMEDVSDSGDQKNNEAIDGSTSNNNDVIPILDETPSLENINEEDKTSETKDSEENSDKADEKVKESDLSQQQEDKNETSNLIADNEEDVKPKNKSKILIIVVLSLLLILDLAALIIYLIGIDKVISFIIVVITVTNIVYLA